VDPNFEDPFGEEADDTFGYEGYGGSEGYGDGDEDLEGYEGPASEEDNHTALPPKFEAWRRRSATGAILTGFALGLQEALEPKREEPAIVVQTSGDPPQDLPVESDFEYRRPRKSVVHIRPWLLRDQGGDPPSEQEGS
jgi:hypothetical protein